MLGEDQTRSIFWLWLKSGQIWKRNSKSQAESRSRACSDTGRLLSAPVLTFYARHAPLLSAGAYQSVVFCIPQSVMHTIILNSNTWHAPLLSTGAYQTTRVQYALHSILHSITHCSQILDIPICHTPHTRMYYSNTHVYSNMYLTYQNYLLCIPESIMHTLLKYISDTGWFF